MWPRSPCRPENAKREKKRGLREAPLIFEASLHIGWRDFRRDLPAILLLAVVGVFLSTFIVGEAISLALDEIPLLAAIAFGALISATDPVAVIAFFRSLGVGKRLALLVEGESLLNDGVAIVLFTLAVPVAGRGAGLWGVAEGDAGGAAGALSGAADYVVE